MKGGLRRRLLVALAAASAGSILLAGLLAAALARPVARADAERELRAALTEIAATATDGRKVRAEAVKRLAGASGAGVAVVASDGRVRRRAGALPRGVDALDTAALLAGEVAVDSRANLVVVAQPLAPTPAGTPVLVATRRIGVVPFGPFGRVLLAAAALSVAGAGVASMILARRLTRPLAAMERAARAIAAGDFDARVEGAGGADAELASLGGAIDTMAAELGRARRLERDFLMSVSHDLRTPLTSIRGYAEAITDGAGDDPGFHRRAATVIAAEGQRLERLVGDLLDLARLDAAEFTLKPRRADIAEVVAVAVAGLAPAAEEAGVALSVDPPDAAVPADIDPERLAQVVVNLTENALKYAATTVTVTLSAGAGDVAIWVDDDGPGIDPADRPHLFERLYTSSRRPARKVGTGLGLAIVAQLVQAMGGTVTAGEIPPSGTRFAVTLPRSC